MPEEYGLYAYNPNLITAVPIPTFEIVEAPLPVEELPGGITSILAQLFGVKPEEIVFI